ncbi:LAFE_0H14400g1_1 [Lachancea fermentati]|uniref:LAFE_0H14400g1_1 n=1 Tax=Lachancea fermentati TaxID=4955 RepID=A0A1G4MKR8_LACFM|nr:LAFE_0H14400g1_1 [Lachancea fermentati]
MNAVSYITNNIIPPKLEETSPRKAKESNARDDPNDNDKSNSCDTEKKSRAEWALVCSIITFLPNMLIIKPILFIWYIITFPLSLMEHVPTDSEEVEQDSSPRTESVGKIGDSKIETIVEEEDDDLGGDEIILQQDAVKGSLTTSLEIPNQTKLTKPVNRSSIRSGSSGTALGTQRMGRFLFPKKLIPQSVLNREKRKTLVLDLDETLIHSMSRGTSSSNSSQGHMVEVKFSTSGISTLYYVHKRPYCDLFLSKVNKWYDLVIFTASIKEYADPVIDWLESSFPGKFRQRLYRQDCILREGVGYIKDLSQLPGSSLNEVFIIDNSPVSYAMHVDNAIQVEGWISDPTDTDLLNLIPLLEGLRFTTDIRNVLSLKNGEQAFNI